MHLERQKVCTICNKNICQKWLQISFTFPQESSEVPCYYWYISSRYSYGQKRPYIGSDYGGVILSHEWHMGPWIMNDYISGGLRVVVLQLLVQLASNTKMNFAWPQSPQLVCNQGNHSVVKTTGLFFVVGLDLKNFICFRIRVCPVQWLKIWFYVFWESGLTLQSHLSIEASLY